MRRRAGAVALAGAVAIACVSAGLIGWRLTTRQAVPPTAPVETKGETAAAPTPAKLSAIIDLPGDPVRIERGAVAAPKELLIAVPPKLTPDAIRPGSPGYAIKQAYFIDSKLASTNGGYMGRFPEAGQEADALAAQLEMNSAQAAGAQTQAQIDAGSDDDGGADTPLDAQAQALTNANSNKLEISSGGAQGKAQIFDTVLKPIVPEKIGDLLIANGFAEESARALESAAAAQLNVHTLPPGSVALAVGALDASGAYRAMQITIFESGEYVGTVALGEGGEYADGAEPAIPTGLIDDSARQGEIAVHYSVADGVYSAGLRNSVPEDVIREAIQLVAGLADLKAPLQPDQTVRVLFMRDFRDKAKSAGRVIYLGLHGGALAVDCYAFEDSDGRFRCFNPKESETPTPQPRPNGSRASAQRRDQRRRHSRADQGRAVTSLFGMRFIRFCTFSGCTPGSISARPSVRRCAAAADGRSRSPGRSPGSATISGSSTPALKRPTRIFRKFRTRSNRGRGQGGRHHRPLWQHGALDRAAPSLRVLPQREAVDPLPIWGRRSRARRAMAAAVPASTSVSAERFVRIDGASEIAAFPAIKSLHRRRDRRRLTK